MTERDDSLLARARDRISGNDVLLVLGFALAVYIAYIGFSAVLGYDINGTVNTLRRITFLSAAYAMLALALNLHWGYAGLFNVGVAGYMAVGVYGMGILAAPTTATPAGFGWPLPLAILGGMVLSAIVGLITALPALRLKADYLAIVTLAFSEIIRLTLLSQTLATVELGGKTYGTGGAQGLTLPGNPVRILYYRNPADPTAGLTPLGEVVFGLFDTLSVPVISGTGVSSTVVIGLTYAVVLVIFVGIFYWFLRRVSNSPFGRVLKAINEDETVTSALGKNTQLFKIKVFMVGTALMGLAAILWQGSEGFTTPGEYMPLLTFYVFVALIIGGEGSNTGSVLGGATFAAILFEGPNYVRRVVRQVFAVKEAPPTFVDALGPLGSLDPLPLFAYTVYNIDALRLVLLGIVLIYLIQNRPEGLLGHRKEPAAAISILGGRPEERNDE